MKENNVYKTNLVKRIEGWRLRDSDSERPVGWIRWGTILGFTAHTVLFRFCRNGGDNASTLGAESLRKLAALAKANGDHETVMALAEYAIGVSIAAPALEKSREARQVLDDAFGHADAPYNPAALEALSVLNSVDN